MTRILPLLAFLIVMPGLAQASCFAEYKAKQDSPLRLHYGILVVAERDCPSIPAATRIASQRLAAAGWTLLNVLALSETQPSDRKRANAGEHYLRY